MDSPVRSGSRERTLWQARDARSKPEVPRHSEPVDRRHDTRTDANWENQVRDSSHNSRASEGHLRRLGTLTKTLCFGDILWWHIKSCNRPINRSSLLDVHLWLSWNILLDYCHGYNDIVFAHPQLILQTVIAVWPALSYPEQNVRFLLWVSFGWCFLWMMSLHVACSLSGNRSFSNRLQAHSWSTHR